jgi:hypothetical protein
MSAHLTDVLPRLLTGDATRAEVLAAAEHLRGCPDCQQELVSAVVAHAALTSAQRFAPAVVAPKAPARKDPPSQPLPDMSAVFEQVRNEVSAERGRPARRRHQLIAVAAAAVVLAGGGITIAETAGSGSSVQPSRAIALAAFGVGTHPARATLVDNRTMQIDAASLPRLDSQHFYEIWLTDTQRKNMQSLGAMPNDNRAEFTVSPKVMSRYSDIEISVQPTGQPAYSGTSVLRGAYS